MADGSNPPVRRQDAAVGFPGSIHVATVRGIRIGLHPSVALIAALFFVSLSQGLLPELSEGHSTAAYWVTGGVTTLLFFVALLTHELAHAVIAQRHGVAVPSIDLWLFGGLAKLDAMPSRPEDELRIALAGPIASIVFAVSALVVAVLLDAAAVSPLIVAAAMWLAVINAALAVFNMLPAFPLDGGRVYAALLWRRTGSRVDAVRRAAATGTMIAVGLGVLGFVEVLAGGGIGGLWLIVLAWFLYQAAQAELAGMTTLATLRHLTCRDVMTPDPVSVHAALPLGEFIEGVLLRERHVSYPVIDDDGFAVGLITIHDVRRAAADARRRPVGDIARPLADVDCFAPETPATELTKLLQGRDGDRALVIEQRRAIGIISPKDLLSIIATAHLVEPRSELASA